MQTAQPASRARRPPPATAVAPYPRLKAAVPRCVKRRDTHPDGGPRLVSSPTASRIPTRPRLVHVCPTLVALNTRGWKPSRSLLTDLPTSGLAARLENPYPFYRSVGRGFTIRRLFFGLTGRSSSRPNRGDRA